MCYGINFFSSLLNSGLIILTINSTSYSRKKEHTQVLLTIASGVAVSHVSVTVSHEIPIAAKAFDDTHMCSNLWGRKQDIGSTLHKKNHIHIVSHIKGCSSAQIHLGVKHL